MTIETEEADHRESPLDARVTALETKVAYQDRLISELDAQAYERLRAMERLEKRVAAITEKLKDLAIDKDESLPDRERPPHY